MFFPFLSAPVYGVTRVGRERYLALPGGFMLSFSMATDQQVPMPEALRLADTSFYFLREQTATPVIKVNDYTGIAALFASTTPEVLASSRTVNRFPPHLETALTRVRSHLSDARLRGLEWLERPIRIELGSVEHGVMRIDRNHVNTIVTVDSMATLAAVNTEELFASLLRTAGGSAYVYNPSSRRPLTEGLNERAALAYMVAIAGENLTVSNSHYFLRTPSEGLLEMQVHVARELRPQNTLPFIQILHFWFEVGNLRDLLTWRSSRIDSNRARVRGPIRLNFTLDARQREEVILRFDGRRLEVSVNHPDHLNRPPRYWFGGLVRVFSMEVMTGVNVHPSDFSFTPDDFTAGLRKAGQSMQDAFERSQNFRQESVILSSENRVRPLFRWLFRGERAFFAEELNFLNNFKAVLTAAFHLTRANTHADQLPLLRHVNDLVHVPAVEFRTFVSSEANTIGINIEGDDSLVFYFDHRMNLGDFTYVEFVGLLYWAAEARQENMSRLVTTADLRRVSVEEIPQRLFGLLGELPYDTQVRKLEYDVRILENNEREVHIRRGADFSFAGDLQQRVASGAAAFAHLRTRPESSLLFPYFNVYLPTPRLSSVRFVLRDQSDFLRVKHDSNNGLLITASLENIQALSEEQFALLLWHGLMQKIDEEHAFQTEDLTDFQAFHGALRYRDVDGSGYSMAASTSLTFSPESLAAYIQRGWPREFFNISYIHRLFLNPNASSFTGNVTVYALGYSRADTIVDDSVLLSRYSIQVPHGNAHFGETVFQLQVPDQVFEDLNAEDIYFMMLHASQGYSFLRWSDVRGRSFSTPALEVLFDRAVHPQQFSRVATSAPPGRIAFEPYPGLASISPVEMRVIQASIVDLLRFPTARPEVIAARNRFFAHYRIIVGRDPTSINDYVFVDHDTLHIRLGNKEVPPEFLAKLIIAALAGEDGFADHASGVMSYDPSAQVAVNNIWSEWTQQARGVSQVASLVRPTARDVVVSAGQQNGESIYQWARRTAPADKQAQVRAFERNIGLLNRALERVQGLFRENAVAVPEGLGEVAVDIGAHEFKTWLRATRRALHSDQYRANHAHLADELDKIVNAFNSSADDVTQFFKEFVPPG